MKNIKIVNGAKFAEVNFEEILSKFHEVLDEYATYGPDFEIDNPDNDVAYWYNERATLSIFAGAIWRLNGHCLE